MSKTFSLSLAAVVLTASGCSATNQVHSELQYRQLVPDSGILGKSGIGVLTPSAPTGQESDRQALGDALGEVLDTDLSDAVVVPLPALLSAVNQAGLSRVYADMFAQYEDTGILARDPLRDIGEAAGVRYVAKLNLGDFRQATTGRVKLAGVRFLDTRSATIRVHLEIWDTWSGAIVWQGNEELIVAQEGVRERPVSFQQVAALASKLLVAKIGESGNESTDDENPSLASDNAEVTSGNTTSDAPSSFALTAAAAPAALVISR